MVRKKNNALIIPFITLTSALAASMSFGESQQVSAYVEAGAGYVNTSDVKFGEYNGLEESGTYPVINFSVSEQAGWNSGDLTYWSAIGENLGLSDRHLQFRFGEADRYRMVADYRELTKNQSDSGHTVFTDDDSNNLKLPAGWVAAADTSGMTGLNGPLTEVTEELRRKRLKLTYQWLASPDNWSLNVDFRHETKEGNRIFYGVIGNSGGNPRATALPSPVDFTFTDMNFRASYADTLYFLQFGYRISLFDNGDQSQSWDNPYLAHSDWDSSAGYPGGRGAIAREPDNRYQQIYATGNLRITPRSSLNASFDYGLMQQDENFLPYSINPSLTVTTPLPRNSLDGELAITRFKLGYRQSLSPKLSLNMSARYEDRDNKTPSDLYVYIGGDSQNQDTTTSSHARYNLPYNFKEKVVDAELHYRWLPRTSLSGSYKFRHITRDYAEVKQTDEQTMGVAVISHLSDTLQSRLHISREVRDGSRYQGENYFYKSYTQAYIDTVPSDEQFENLPALRRFYIADRERDQAGLRVNWTPTEKMDIGLFLRHAEDSYDDSDFGLNRSKLQSANIDVSYLADNRFNVSLFAGYDLYKSRQYGRNFRGFAVATESADPTRNWRFDSEDQAKTIGCDIEVYQIAPKTDMTLSYLQSYARTEMETEVGSSLSSEPIPNQNDRLNRIAADFAHHYSPHTTILLKLAHEKYTADDFATDQVTQSTMANVIALGNETPSYSVNWFQLSLRYSF